LTVLAADAFARLKDNQIGADDDTLLALLREIANRVARGRKVRNPANPGEDLNRLTDDEWAAFSKGIDEFVEIAASGCAANDEIEAADYWSRAFAQFFPMPDIRTALATGGVVKSQALVPITLPDVIVRAVGKKNPNVKLTGKNGIGPIPKECTITFEMVDPWKLPPGATVDWMVRNEGDEAEYLNDLGHRAGTGFMATESSAYAGTHYMDCILRQNGRIYGVSRIPVRISGMNAPLRNPVARPSWTNARARR
jgi:Adenylyl/Guanylyl and SMODS C-terminal sensor domain